MSSPTLSSNTILKVAVVSSVFLHGVIIASSFGLVSFKPQYGVTQAPSSVEVQLIEEKLEPVPQVQTEQVLTAESQTQAKVSVEKEEPKPLPKIEKPMPAPVEPQAGAVRKEAEAYLDNPAPVYPERARLRGWEGLVLLSVAVDDHGFTEQVQLQSSSGHQLLDEAAIKAVKKWRFKPAGVGNVTFSSTVRIPVRFRLTDA